MIKFCFVSAFISTLILAIATMVGFVDLTPIMILSPVIVVLIGIAILAAIILIPFLLYFVFFGILAVMAFVIGLFKD